ncbi:response regulator transcription factor [Myroides sp. JBRI-B21084]|uniref:LytR/AlgR family response regulator transcription factor n=1 Tax=Myroides sp. JBRI-B21084 TaxID=3119977 RepID=UPI0026E23344|nr:response regulator transcription factor [Paenimyroides cloacae]WKW47124.1 response regulator transcription factor [Paenimyroides cloacae]
MNNSNCKILIVEDEILIANFILKMLQNEGFTTTEVAYNSITALEKFATFLPEIILLDINLETKNSGIELAKKKNKQAKIIYLTAQNDTETIQKAIETNPETYLTKPIKKTDVLAAIQLASIKNTTKHITIRNGYTNEIISFDAILYIIAEKNYIDIYTLNGKFTIRKSLSHFLEELPANFIQIHRSIVINKKHIQKKSASKVFINNVELTISRNFTFTL